MDGKLNYQSSQKVTHISPEHPQKQSAKEGVLALIRGIAKQIVVQIRLADEFGVPYSQLFTEDFRGLDPVEIENQIIAWLRAGSEGAESLVQLTDELLAHQIAVISGMDGIVTETLNKIAPEASRDKKGHLNKKNFKDYAASFSELDSNIVKRHQQVVVPGFLTSYIKSRTRQKDEPVKVGDTD